jgi:hypothetical protein
MVSYCAGPFVTQDALVLLSVSQYLVAKILKSKILSKILGFHGSDYEEWRILGRYDTWLL